ncbi:MAG: hypothetical protein AAF699_10110 [Pseudomonadota bacterium]
MAIGLAHRDSCFQLLFIFFLIPFLVGSKCAIFVSSGDSHDYEHDERKEEDGLLVTTSSGTLGNPPIAGINYRSANLSGVTGDQGEFEYSSAHPVQFSIGELDIGSPVPGNTLVTISDLAMTNDRSNTSAVNIKRLLTALDTNPADARITISEEVRALAQRSNDHVRFAIEFMDFSDNTAFVNNASQLVATLTKNYTFTATLPDRPDKP